MAAGVPPPPLNSPSGSYYWLEWYTSLTNFLNGTNIPWSNLNFTGSNLTDIQTRNHNDLLNIQGGNTTSRYHGIGQLSSDATATVTTLPSTWTIAHTATGTYTVTHGLGITPTAVMAVANVNTTTAGLAWTNMTTPNAFVVYTSTPAGALTDVAFTCIVMALT